MNNQSKHSNENPWQPIETAPKDGTEIDILLNGKSRLTDIYWGEWQGNDKQQEYWLDDLGNPVVGDWDNLNKITHWMPIPKPPEG